MFFSRQNKKRIAQLLPSFAEHDAMSDYVKSWNEILTKGGFSMSTFARFLPGRSSLKIRSYLDFNQNEFDLAILHLGIGDPINDIVKDLSIPLVVYYHNITPARFYKYYNWDLYELLVRGREQLNELASFACLGIGASKFSEKELIENNYRQTSVIPVFFDPRKLGRIQSSSRIKKYLNKEEITNITFLGRFSKHKAQIDLVKAFYIYRKYYNPKSRLNLVGNIVEQAYLGEVTKLIRALKIAEFINIPGIVSDEEMRAYYEESSVFISMSEHEGFFVPVLEANYYKVPMIAFDAGAVSETMGEAGILLDTKKPEIVASTIDRLVRDHNLRKYIIEKGTTNYKRFDQSLFTDVVVSTMKNIINSRFK